MIDLTAKPFNLNAEDIRWVKDTLASLSDEEKVTQLFCLVGYSADEEYLTNLAEKVRPGGLMCRPQTAEGVVRSAAILQSKSRIPMLLAANLEKGGIGASKDYGSSIGSEMAVAATDDVETATHLGTVCAREGAALGMNWAFAPIVDIDYNFRNPITNTRTFGSDPERVKAFGLAYLKAAQKYGVATSFKHFPGDGRDDRDQHLVSTVNDLSCEEWDKTYGAIYQAGIDAGTLTIMTGHIMQPAYSRHFNPSIEDKDILPGSLSKELLTDLLRGKMGFNGLIVTDASTMNGMAIPMPRWKMVPAAVAAGCDMFLFTKTMEEDIEFMRQGIKDGVITEERLTEALTRILATKAALGLHRKQKDGSLIPDLDKAIKVMSDPDHKKWAEECADKSITLVKEEKGVLPLDPKKYKKILFYPIQGGASYSYGARAGVMDEFLDRLHKQGFDVDVFKPVNGVEGTMQPYKTIPEKYDLIIYLANLATKSNQTTVRIEWADPMGANVPTYMSVVPTIFISVENPYHLQDAPRVRTFINTYGSADVVLDQLIEKLMGRSEFKGKSPSDPFCGMWDTHL